MISPPLLRLIEALAESAANEDDLAAQAQQDAAGAAPRANPALPATNEAA
jgi:hypothetical protein